MIAGTFLMFLGFALPAVAGSGFDLAPDNELDTIRQAALACLRHNWPGVAAGQRQQPVAIQRGGYNAIDRSRSATTMSPR